MASIGQLVRVVSEMSGLDESSVKLIARYLREAGLIGQQSTGAGAAKMTARDASALLIAVNSTALAKDSASVAGTFYDLPCSAVPPKTSNSEIDYLIGELCRLSCFGDGLSRLIELYMPTAAGLSVLQYKPDDAPIRVRISLERPTNAASIFVWEYAGQQFGIDMTGATCSVYFASDSVEDLDIDRTISVQITGKTIFAVANLLAN